MFWIIHIIVWILTCCHIGFGSGTDSHHSGGLGNSIPWYCTTCTTRTVSSSSEVARQVVPNAAKITSIQLRREISRAGTCKAGRNYGYYGPEIWADEGCRGEFYVCFYEGFTQSVSCSSERMRRRTCNYRRTCSTVSSVSVRRAASNNPCVDGFSFEAGTSSITVTKGCRASFNIGCLQCDRLNN